MSPRGRKAVLPPAGFQATPRTDDTGLKVTVVNNRGASKVYDFAVLTELGVPEPMQVSLARVFAAQSRRWNRHSAATSYWSAVRAFALFLRDQGHPARDLDEVSPAVLKLLRNTFTMAPGKRLNLGNLLRLLRRDPRLNQGLAAEELARPAGRSATTRQSMDEDERQQVRLAAQREFRAALLRIRENTVHMGRYRSGELAEGSPEWRIGRILDHLAATGDVPRTTGGSTPMVANAKLLGGMQPSQTWGRLFLTRPELIALAVLMTDRWGWNLSMHNHLPVPVRTPSAGEANTITYQVQVEKHRAGEGRWWDTENITDSGAESKGRLITQALEATAHGRALAARLAPGSDLLMVYRLFHANTQHRDRDRPPHVGPLGFGLVNYDAANWKKRHGLARSPFQPLRRTTTVDEGQPLQHKQGTHESVYVLPDKRVQKNVRKIIAAGAEEALQQARDVTYMGQLTAAPAPGDEETVTSDCSASEPSPWPAPGGGCEAGFMSCLACTNSRVHDGHHPRLALLRKHLISLRGVLSDRHFDRTWREPLLRLDNLRERVGEAVFDAALHRATDRDRMIVGHLLKGDLTP
ncbi:MULTISPECIES: hypothetical protein [unclassified Streptomyces]|uniref:hypothetical protein n=1 Tax=unclassified Streptomyces TaxID=2593676 RepID=UPI00037084BF|nr:MULTISPECIES: hypothetical protein [unclassified Streptomyces]MYQ81642.1 hypothetical protein [Streptomyces sp. SID4923]